MDKPSSTDLPFRTRRPAFALILTLAVLAVIIALTGVLVGYLDTARKDASSTRALVQANLYFTDIKGILSRFKERKTLYATLYLGAVPLQSEDGRFSLFLVCRPMYNGININWFGLGNSMVMKAQYNAVQKVFSAVAQKYALSDPARLEEMILEVVRPEKAFPDEAQSRLRQKNGIITYQQFEQLLSRYQFETDDGNVGSVPWQRYFVFHPLSDVPEENRVAGDYISIELLSVLFDLDSAVLSEEWTASEGALKALLERYGITYDKQLFSDTFIDRSVCEVGYTYQGDRYMFSFVDSQGEVKDFAFYGKQ